MTVCVLFDLDETVLDRTVSLQKFVHWQAREMLRGQIFDPVAFEQRFIQLDNNGKVWKDRVYAQLIKEYSIENWTVSELLHSYELCFCAFCTTRPGIQSTLERLHTSKYPMAIVSNGKSPFQERNARSLPEHKYFDEIFVSDAVGIRKPDAKIFDLACETLGADIKRSVFIGDNPIADMRGAKNAGMRTIHVPLENPGIPCRDADSTVLNLFDLPEILDDLVN